MQTCTAFLPYSIPLVLGLFVTRVPPWAAWTTVLIGLGVSFLVKIVLDPDLFRQLMGLESALTSKETAFYFYFYFYLVSVLGNVVIAGGWYLFTTRFYESSSEESQSRDAAFFERMETPLISTDDSAKSDESDFQQRALLGKMCLVYGGCIMLMVLIPYDIQGRLVLPVLRRRGGGDRLVLACPLAGEVRYREWRGSTACNR